MTDHILTEQSDRILTIRFNRADKKNALTAAMYDAIAEALTRARTDADVRVVLLAGSADCFTSGNDLADFRDNPPSGEDSPVLRFMNAVIALDKPLVAAVNGIAVGVGVTVLLHCDLVYCGERTRLQMPFVNIGACPEFASTYLLPLTIGLRRATALCMLGEPFDAKSALEFGLVNALQPNDQTEAVARKAALRLASQPPAALRTCKALLRRPHATEVRASMDVENRNFMPMLRAPEAREALAAFMEKRSPDFSRFG